MYPLVEFSVRGAEFNIGDLMVPKVGDGLI